MNILVWLGNEKMHQAIYPNMKSLAKAFADMGHNVMPVNLTVFRNGRVGKIMVLPQELEKFLMIL